MVVTAIASRARTVDQRGPVPDWRICEEAAQAHDIVDVCICSFKRPEIAWTLTALSHQVGIDKSKLRVIVADNSDTGELRQIILRTARDLALNLVYVFAPANNISTARNACLDASTAPWIAFLDDDEVPTQQWLCSLLSEAKRGEWDAVLGPVQAIYGSDTPSWIRRGDFNSTAPVRVRGVIDTAYTGNILFRRQFAQSQGLRFRSDLGKCGGEDEELFSRFFEAGGRIGFAPHAIAYERVPEARARMAWLLKRNFRAGQTYGSRLLKRNRREVLVLTASAKAIACGVCVVLFLANRFLRNRFVIRGALHLGVVARLVGFREIDIY